MAPDDENTNDRVAELRARWEADRSSRVFAQLAETLRRDGRTEEAVEVLQAGLSHHPTYLSALLTMARCRLDLEQPAAAVQVLEKVIARDATHAVAYRLLIEAQLAQGDAEAARDRLETYSMLNEADPEVAADFKRRIRLADRHEASPDDTASPVASATEASAPATGARAETAAVPPVPPTPPGGAPETPELPSPAGAPIPSPASALDDRSPAASADAADDDPEDDDPFGALDAGPAAVNASTAEPEAAPTVEADDDPFADDPFADLGLGGDPPDAGRTEPPPSTPPPSTPAPSTPAEPETAASSFPAGDDDPFDLPPAGSGSGEEVAGDGADDDPFADLVGLPAAPPAPDLADLADLAPEPELEPDASIPEPFAAAEETSPEAGHELPPASAPPVTARSESRSADEAPPERPRATATLGLLYLEQGHVDEAERLLEEVLDREPDNDRARQGLEAVADARRAAEAEADADGDGDEAAGAPALQAADLLSDYDPDVHGGGVTDRKRYVLERYLERLRGVRLLPDPDSDPSVGEA